VIGILPAAGFGTRIGLPYPKELLPIIYRPNQIITIIETCLLQFLVAGINEVVIVLRPEKDIIRDYLGDNYQGIEIRYTYQQDKKTKEGLPDGILAAYELGKDHDICVMLMPDVYLSDIHTTRSLINKLSEYSEAIAAVSVWRTNEPWRFGIVEFKKNELLSVVDKPKNPVSDYHWGAVAFRQPFWNYLQKETETLSNTLNQAVKDKVVLSYSVGDYIDCGTPSSFINGIVKVNK